MGSADVYVDSGQELVSNKIEDNSFSAEQKFAAVIETALLSEHELAGNCRQQGMYVEHIKQWKVLSIAVHATKQESQYKLDSVRRADKKKIKLLEKELNRKDKALAETAALLVLREKYNALWDNSEED